jgi:hypothetical protein
MTEGTGTADGLISMKAGVCLRSAANDPDSVTIDAQQLGRVIYIYDIGAGAVVEGLTITGGSIGDAGAGIYVSRSSPTIRNCHVVGNELTDWNTNGPGICCFSQAPTTVENCVISNNVSTQNGNAYGGGLFAYYYSDIAITSCTFCANTSKYGSHVAATVASDAVLDRCILVNGLGSTVTGPTYCVSNSDIDLTCSDVWGNSVGDYVGCIAGQNGINGNFSADPVFCGAAGGDFHLMSGSPCIDAPGCGLVGALGWGCRRPNHWYVPFDAPSIQAGVDSAAHGDTLIVACGTYYENVSVDVNVTIMSETGEPDCATIDGQHLGRAIEFTYLASATPQIEGFTITGGHAEYAAGVYCNDSDARVINCVVTDNSATDFGGGIVCNTCEHFIRDCIIRNNSGGSYAGGAGVFGATGNFENCTFYGNDAPLGGCYYANGQYDTLSNCILSFSTQGEAVYCDAGHVVMSCCDVYGNAGGDYVGCIAGELGVNGNFSADPLFCYPDGDDFYLHWTSPCIDTLGCGQVGALGPGCVARTWYVSTAGNDTTGDGTAIYPFATIQYGLDRAFWGDTVEVECGNYFEHDITMKSGVLLTSSTGTWDCARIDAGGTSRAFQCDSLDTATAIRGFTIRGGVSNVSGGAMYLDYAELTVANCKFDTCTAGGHGGAIYAMHSSPTVSSCFFAGGSTGHDGGAIYFYECDPIVTDCVFSENVAAASGGAMAFLDCPDFDINLCSAEFNHAYWGGVVQARRSPGVINLCSFRDNTSETYGGAICMFENSHLGLIGSFIYDNNSVGYGSGVYAQDCTADIAMTTFYGNNAYPEGGSVYGYNASLDIDNTIIAFGRGGGAVGCTGGSIYITCSDVYGNVGGDWVGCIAGQDTADNFSADPLFCNPDLDDFHVAPYSPCLTGPCGQIGGLGAGIDCYSVLPSIVGVADVGNDQGRQARLKWRRTAYDVPGNEMDITGYTIFRRQDAHLSAPAIPEEEVATDVQAALGTDAASTDASTDMPILMAEGWDQIDYVLAYGDSIYQAVVPTLCDSTDEGTCWSVFMVRATSSDPFTYFDSDPDSGYSIDNLAPAPPPGLMMASATELDWDEVPDEDFDYYSVYGSALDHLDETATLVGYTIDTGKDVTGHVYDYYHVTATDFSGNEGEESSVNNVFAGVPGIPDPGDIPTAFALKQNRPNPFSTTTVIAFDLPAETNARIRIYDTHGRIITRLTDKRYEAGRHAVTWRGEDEAGNQVGPGVYFIRMQAGEFKAMKKVLLLR